MRLVLCGPVMCGRALCGPVLFGPVLLGMSTVLLSGCSWLGYGNSSYSGGASQASNGAYYQNGVYQQNSASQLGAQIGVQAGAQSGYGMQPAGACQITSPTQRVPQGCAQENVTLAVGGVGGAGSQYGQQGQYTTGGYGSHSGGNVQTSTQYHTSADPKFKRPKLRGSLGLEIDHSVSGNLYAPGVSGSVAAYNRANFAEGFTTGSIAGRQVVQTLYTSVPEQVLSPEISFDDVYTAPLRLTGGLEYIFSDHATVFANAGYTRSEGKKGGGAQIIDELQTRVTTADFDALGAPVGVPITNTTFIPNQIVAKFNYEFNDEERIDLELGGRYYFNPIMKDSLSRTLTPFVSASGGAAHYSETTVTETQQQLFLTDALTSSATDLDFYDVGTGTQTQIYDSQWVPYGSVKAGVEWQMTPRTALAFEAGVKYENSRDFSNGAKGDSNVSIPVAIRGSYNF